MLTLEEWNSKLPIPGNMETVRRWVRNGQIWPPPLFDGYRYLVEDNAVKHNKNSRKDRKIQRQN